ncbi:hypothetical protein ACFROC_29215 [Nocardia tengchongensis]|uniref:hypothetical protein n=1 Tax=Nocardia tengchongensis TaxID=2055889 RepID=UPI0036BB3A93
MMSNRGVNTRFDALSRLILEVINTKGSNTATCAKLAQAAAQAAAAERNADLARVAEIATALAQF